MNAEFFSIRMRASLGGQHISGAERLATADRVEALTAQMTARALAHSRGVPDEIRITVETVPPAALRFGQLPDLTTVPVATVEQGRTAALAELVRAGVSELAAKQTMAALTHGAAPDGGSLRGALLVDAASGVRLEPDQARGVRASHMDLAPAAEAELRAVLASRGLDNEHVREALALAAKVMQMPGFVAELCWSDDPPYTAGYVTSRQRGYVRYPHLKQAGDPNGGRAFFVQPAGFDLAAALDFLQRTPILFDRIGAIHPDEA